VRDDTVFVDKLALRTAESTLSFDGAVQNYLTKPVFNLEISSDKLSLPNRADRAGTRRRQAAAEVPGEDGGVLDRLGIDMNVQSTAGDMWARSPRRPGPGQSVSGHVSVRHLDLAPILRIRRRRATSRATRMSIFEPNRSRASTRCAHARLPLAASGRGRLRGWSP